jgi:tetratricopeptide (TPR) repeat protein
VVLTAVPIKAERTRRLLDRARARRFGLVVALVVLLIGTAVSTTLYIRERDAQKRTAAAAAQSKAVTEFLSKDVFAPVSSDAESVKDMTVIELLTRAGNEIDQRFTNQPDIAAELHYVFGRSFLAFYESPLAVHHFQRAMDLDVHAQGSDSALRSAAELVQIDYLLGRLRDTMPRYSLALAAGLKRLPPSAPTILELRLRLARGYYLLGDWSKALPAFKSVLADAEGKASPELLGKAELYCGQLLIDLSESNEAQVQLRNAIAQLTRAFSEKHELVAEARAELGRALAASGRYAEAQAELNVAAELGMRWAPPDTWTAVRPRFYMALMLLQEDDAAKAEHILADIVNYADSLKSAYMEKHKDLPIETDSSWPVRQALGEAYARTGKLAEAIATLQVAVKLGELADGPEHSSVLSARLDLAEALIADHREAAARDMVAAISPAELAKLPAVHPILAQWNLVKGLLAMRQEDMSDARRSLQTASEIYQSLYGATNWHAVRSKRELLLTTGREVSL